MFERILKNALIQQPRSNKILHPSQYGFIPGRFFTSIILTAMDSLTRATDNGHISCAVFSDFDKASHRVPYISLLRRLQSGVVGLMLEVIHSFLTGRNFAVKVREASVQPAPVTAGVARSPMLGPLLCSWHTYDLSTRTPVSIAIYKNNVISWNPSMDLS